VSFWCFDVAAQYFEEILLDLKKHNNQKKLKVFIKHIECSDVLCSWYLAGVNMNVCGAAETPEEQAGK